MNNIAERVRLSDEQLTDRAILELRSEAAVAGDLAMVGICDRALSGQRPARRTVAAVIEQALGMLP